MWAVRADGGRTCVDGGRRRLPEWVDRMVFPLGRRTEMGRRVWRTLVVGVLVVMKWPVAPLSMTSGGFDW